MNTSIARAISRVLDIAQRCRRQQQCARSARVLVEMWNRNSCRNGSFSVFAAAVWARDARLTYPDVRRRHPARVVGLARRRRAAQRRRGTGARGRVRPRGRHWWPGGHAGAAARLVAADLVRVVSVAAVVVIVAVICKCTENRRLVRLLADVRLVES